MIRLSLIVIFTLSCGLLRAQSTAVKASNNFVTASQEIKEAGKNFYAVDLNYLPNENSKNTFLESLYAEKKVFPVSVVRQDNTILICGYESAISKEQVVVLMDDLLAKAKASTSATNGTVEKFKAK